MGISARSAKISHDAKEKSEPKDSAVVRITINIEITPQQAAKALKLITVALIALSVR